MRTPKWAQKRAASSSRERERRSGFERLIEKQLVGAGVEYVYEKEPLYFIPVTLRRRKTFDWFITTRSGKEIIVETKGWWEPKARIAELQAIEQNPDRDIRYVFQRLSAKIRKGSKTTYADVCRKAGVPCAEGLVPQEWLDE